MKNVCNYQTFLLFFYEKADFSYKKVPKSSFFNEKRSRGSDIEEAFTPRIPCPQSTKRIH